MCRLLRHAAVDVGPHTSLLGLLEECWWKSRSWKQWSRAKSGASLGRQKHIESWDSWWRTHAGMDTTTYWSLRLREILLLTVALKRFYGLWPDASGSLRGRDRAGNIRGHMSRPSSAGMIRPHPWERQAPLQPLHSKYLASKTITLFTVHTP